MSEKPIKPLSKPRLSTSEIDTSLISLPDKPKPKQTLTFNDGLNFGMGFFVAGFLFFVCVMPISLAALYIFLLELVEVFGPNR